MTLSTIISEDADRIAAQVDLSPLAGKTVLVAGATGLLGTYLMAALAKSDATRVVGLARSIDKTKDTKRVSYFPTSLTCCLPSALKGKRFDYVIHAAGSADPSRFLDKPVDTIAVNTAGTIALFGSLAPRGRYMYLSSSEVYSGLPSPHFEYEIGTTGPGHPRAPYIEGKRCGEAIVHAHRRGGLNAVIARPALAYGPGTRKGDGRVINVIIKQALTEGRVTLADQGLAIRSYVYVADATAMLLNILLRGGQVTYNVGATAPRTVSWVARLIAEYAGAEFVKPTIGGIPLAGAPHEVRLSMKQYTDEFGPFAYTQFTDGLRRTMDWQKLLYADDAEVAA